MRHPEPTSFADLIVVGGGPAGMSAAITAASRGHHVIVLEEHPRVGAPVHCTGVLAQDAFSELALPQSSILNELSQVRFHAPGGGVVDYETPTIEAVVIDRAQFDDALATRARMAGAQVEVGARVADLRVAPDAVTAVLADGREMSARAAVIASGANYTLQRRLGMGLPAVYLQSAQRELPAGRTGPVEVFFGRSNAPKGFAWAVPVTRPDGCHVRVGVMAERNVDQCFADVLARVAPRWGIERTDQAPRRKMLPLSTVARSYADRVLAAGDAAGLVKPTTGGGIYYAVVSGRLAGHTMSVALEADRLSARDLSEYQRQWRRRFMSEFGAQLALRMLAHRMSDEAIDRLFELALTDGVMPIIRRFARFNQHQGFIRELLRHPPARRLLFRRLTSSIL